MLRDFVLGLKQDAAPIGAGAVRAACCAAIESMFTSLLPTPQKPGGEPSGLTHKARALAASRPARDDAEARPHGGVGT